MTVTYVKFKPLVISCLDNNPNNRPTVVEVLREIKKINKTSGGLYFDIWADAAQSQQEQQLSNGRQNQQGQEQQQEQPQQQPQQQKIEKHSHQKEQEQGQEQQQEQQLGMQQHQQINQQQVIIQHTYIVYSHKSYNII